jgi:hypothetical protein
LFGSAYVHRRRIAALQHHKVGPVSLYGPGFGSPSGTAGSPGDHRPWRLGAAGTEASRDAGGAGRSRPEGGRRRRIFGTGNATDHPLWRARGWGRALRDKAAWYEQSAGRRGTGRAPGDDVRADRRRSVGVNGRWPMVAGVPTAGAADGGGRAARPTDCTATPRQAYRRQGPLDPGDRTPRDLPIARPPRRQTRQPQGLTRSQRPHATAPTNRAATPTADPPTAGADPIPATARHSTHQSRGHPDGRAVDAGCH